SPETRHPGSSTSACAACREIGERRCRSGKRGWSGVLPERPAPAAVCPHTSRSAFAVQHATRAAGNYDALGQDQNVPQYLAGVGLFAFPAAAIEVPDVGIAVEPGLEVGVADGERPNVVGRVTDDPNDGTVQRGVF